MKIVFVLMLYCAFLISQEYVVIVNKRNPLKTITPEMIKRIYLGKSTKWPFGARIAAIDHHPKSEIRETFSKVILEKNVKKMLKYWLKEVIRGKGKPPQMLIETKSILNAVKSTPGAISYIRKEDLTSEIKVIYTFQQE